MLYRSMTKVSICRLDFSSWSMVTFYLIFTATMLYSIDNSVFIAHWSWWCQIHIGSGISNICMLIKWVCGYVTCTCIARYCVHNWMFVNGFLCWIGYSIIQWNPCKVDTIGTKNFVRCSKVSLALGFNLVVDHIPLTIAASYDKALLWTMKKTVLMRDLSTDIS